jgi:drug/metabolite transporter (DMT)-like permease
MVLSTVELIIILLVCLLQAFGSYSFIKSCEIGEVSIVAPISGTYSLITVFLAILFLGESLTTLRLVSIFFIVFGIILVSTDFSKLRHLHTVKGVKEVFMAVLCWGIYFFLLAYVKNSFFLRNDIETAKLIFGINIFLFTNLFGGIFSIIISLMLKARFDIIDMKPKVTILFLVNLVLYTIAWVAINAGLVTEMVSLLAPVSSLYPAITVILAAIVLKEKLVKNQYIGLVVILAGIFMLGF